MSTFSKELLSGSTDGLGIKITQAATPGTTIHTAHVTAKDEVWIYVVNESALNINVTVEWGGTTAVDNNISFGIAPKIGLELIIPGLILQNSKVVKIFASSANVIVAYGFVNRITP
jgi:hypothetical protein